jgi:hypothetical protein
MAGASQQDETEGSGCRGGKNAGPGSAEGAVAAGGMAGGSARQWHALAHGRLPSEELPVAHEHFKQYAFRYRGQAAFSPMLADSIPRDTTKSGGITS